jgi:hypothetical protein
MNGRTTGGQDAAAPNRMLPKLQLNDFDWTFVQGLTLVPR